jgi:ADP-ribose pyrophosphatase YjhB (NUDIX family)
MAKVLLVAGPVIVEKDKVLLNNHGDTDFWKFCGGRVEDIDSNLMETAKREVKEEMGLDIKILDETPFITHDKKKIGDEYIDIILVHFLAERTGRIKAADDIREWGWFDVRKLPFNIGSNIEPTLRYFGLIK